MVKSNVFLMAVMSTLFFMVGFVTTMNNALIDFLANSSWELTLFEKQLINTAFFGAYLFSIPLSWILDKLGYKKTTVLSLFIIASGFVLTYPAVIMGYYPFLFSMFIVALGIAMLQIVLNPYVLSLGSPEKAASRLNLTGFFNSVATVVAPLFVVFVSSSTTSNLNPLNVQIPFLIIAIFIGILGLLLSFLKMPEILNEKMNDGSDGNIYKNTRVIFGALAIFIYMGIEISIPSFLPDRMRTLNLQTVSILGWDLNATQILSLYWAGLMIGRLLGAYILRGFSARRLLTYCAILGIVLISVSLCLVNKWAIFLLLFCGLANSIMWGSIFNLALENLGNLAKRASGIVCSFAIGGAILPPLMGYLQQAFGDLTLGTILVLSCVVLYYLYIIVYSEKFSRMRST